MKAYLQTPIQRSVRACLAIAFLAISLLGTHWLGYAHSIAHPHTGQAPLAGFNAPLELASHDDCDAHHHAESLPALHGDHISANCLLFDALTLAVFVGTANFALLAVQTLADEPIVYSAVFNTNAVLSHYQSRAPPQSLQL
jgi:hypothetical protein